MSNKSKSKIKIEKKNHHLPACIPFFLFYQKSLYFCIFKRKCITNYERITNHGNLEPPSKLYKPTQPISTTSPFQPSRHQHKRCSLLRWRGKPQKTSKISFADSRRRVQPRRPDGSVHSRNNSQRLRNKRCSRFNIRLDLW